MAKATADTTGQKAPKRTLVPHQSTSYQRFFSDFVKWCRENQVKPFGSDKTVIVRYLTALKDSPLTANGQTRQRSPNTLKVKLTAIKRYYEINGYGDKINFKEFNSKFFREFCSDQVKRTTKVIALDDVDDETTTTKAPAGIPQLACGVVRL